MKFLILSMMLFLIVGCFDQSIQTHSLVRIKMPSKLIHKLNKSNRSTVNYNCYAVFVTWQSSTSYCSDDQDTIITRPNLIAGFAKITDPVTLLVPTGAKRKIEIILTASEDGACSEITNLTWAKRKQLTDISLVGSVTKDLVRAEESVEITASLTNKKTIQKCVGDLFLWEEETSSNVWDQAIWDQASFGD